MWQPVTIPHASSSSPPPVHNIPSPAPRITAQLPPPPRHYHAIRWGNQGFGVPIHVRAEDDDSPLMQQLLECATNNPPIHFQFTQHARDTDAQHQIYRIPYPVIAFGNEMYIRVHCDTTRAEVEACFRWCNLIDFQFWHASNATPTSERGHFKLKPGYVDFNSNFRLATVPDRWPASTFSTIGDTAQRGLMWPELLFSYVGCPGVQ